MRISTTLGILDRAIRGDTPDGIAARMHLGRDTVTEVLERAGWPNLTAVKKWRDDYTQSGGNGDRAVAETAAQLATAARHDPAWIDQYTEWRTHEQLRELVRVMAQMLPAGIDPLEARAWTGRRRGGRPKKVAAA